MMRGRLRRAWAACVLAALALVAVRDAFAASPALAEYAHDTWTTSQGLPHNAVLDIAQTRDGYLWFGTWEGLARYNGMGFATLSRTSVRGGSMMPTMPVQIMSRSNASLWSAISSTSPAALEIMPGTSAIDAVSSGR